MCFAAIQVRPEQLARDSCNALHIYDALGRNMTTPLANSRMGDLQRARQFSHGTTASEVFLKGVHICNGSGASKEMQATPALFRKRCFQNDNVDDKLRNRAARIHVSPLQALGRRLREARERAEKTQEHVGEKLELTSHSSVGQWERGETLIQTINLILAAQIYGESLDWLVFGMKGKLEERVAALPEILRENVMAQIRAAIENAETMARTHPALFQNEFVRDSDPRLTEWSAKDKPKKRIKGKPAVKKKKPSGGAAAN